MEPQLGWSLFSVMAGRNTPIHTAVNHNQLLGCRNHFSTRDCKRGQITSPSARASNLWLKGVKNNFGFLSSICLVLFILFMPRVSCHSKCSANMPVIPQCSEPSSRLHSAGTPSWRPVFTWPTFTASPRRLYLQLIGLRKPLLGRHLNCCRRLFFWSEAFETEAAKTIIAPQGTSWHRLVCCQTR